MPDQITRLLDEIEQLDKDATPGPWISEGITPDHGLFDGIVIYREGEPGAIAEVQPIRSDAELVALSRTALPALAQAVRAVLGVLDDYPLPDRTQDPTGYTTARIELLEDKVREAISDAIGDGDGY